MNDTSPCASGNSGTTMHCSSAFSEDHDRVDELRTTLIGQLKITNDVPTVPVERNDLCDDEGEEEEEEEEEDDFSEEDLLVRMGYAKSDPKRDYKVEDEEEDLSEESTFARMEPPKHEPINTPIAELNLVSAFKGSRDKEEGRPGKGCRVSWAPDVYDPPCTSDDHFTDSRSGSHKGEQKASKNRQKGGGKRGGEIEGRGGGGKRSRGGGGSKGNEGGSKAGGGSKEKKKAEKKHKKRGDSGSSSRHSGHGEY